MVRNRYEYMVTSEIVSYGGASVATSSVIFQQPTPVTFTSPYYYSNSNYSSLTDLFGPNLVLERLKSCAPAQVERIKKKLEDRSNFQDSSFQNSRRGALFCRSGNWLEILDETIRGTKDESSAFTVVEFISVAISLISIRGVQTNSFMCMDPSGKLYSTPASNYSSECVFIEEMALNYYNLYSSCSYGSRQNPWYLELRKTGKPRRGPQTKKRRKASHFLVVHHDLTRHGQIDSDLVIASLYHQPPSRPLRRLPFIQGTARISNVRAKLEIVSTSEPPPPEKQQEVVRSRNRTENRRQSRLLREERRRQARRERLKMQREQELANRRQIPTNRYSSSRPVIRQPKYYQRSPS